MGESSSFLLFSYNPLKINKILYENEQVASFFVTGPLTVIKLKYRKKNLK